MIVTNVERETLQEAARYIYNVTDDEESEAQANHFCVSEINLLDNGWVKVTRHDTGVECFPPSRIVTLEDLTGPDAAEMVNLEMAGRAVRHV
jgi:hypothetical protein